MTHVMPNLDDLMIIDPSGLDPRELRNAIRTANEQTLMLVAAVRKYEKAIATRDQVGTELHGFVEGVLKAHLRGDMGEVAKIANAYFEARPTYRERLEEDVEHDANKGAH
ncbi:hypothetical protein DF052_06970 [Burkholderia glumae]|nr:hypothetical protein DF052_06970 [Burkholderia glumae]